MYSQIFGIIFYILYGKIMKKVIKWAGRRDEEDPWQIILWNRNQDFLENDNFFMSICVIQIMNTILGLQVLSYFHTGIDYENFNIAHFNAFHTYINTPLEISGLLTWAVLIWRGTKKDEFFSRLAAIIFGIIGFLILAGNSYAVVASYYEEEDFANEGFVIMIINLGNQLYVYGKYFFAYVWINLFNKELNDFEVDTKQNQL